MAHHGTLAYPYHAGDFDFYGRHSRRSMSTTGGYYDRAVPYGYYGQPRPAIRSELGRRSMTRAAIQQFEQETINGQQRRRVTVACQRCRKRKVKCSGDSGDGKACQFCKASGSEVAKACNFMRMNSIPMSSVATHSSRLPNTPATQDVEPLSYTPESGAAGHRSSLPALHTRGTYSVDYEQPNDSTAYGEYNLGPSGRQDSVASTVGLENYRSWPATAGSTSTPSDHYDQQPSYSFDSLQFAGLPQTTQGRLPSVSSDPWSSWNMNSLQTSLPAQTAQQTSLPAQTVQERRLPIPYVQSQQPTYDLISVPDVRLPMSEPRVHINGVHSRNTISWSPENQPHVPQVQTTTHVPDHQELPRPTTHRHLPPPVHESSFDYQFPTHPDNNSGPETSPTSVRTHANALGRRPTSSGMPTSSVSSNHMLPSTFRYLTQPRHRPPPVSNVSAATSRRSSLETVSQPSLYSFSTETGDSQNQAHLVQHDHADPVIAGVHSAEESYLRHPQPYRTVSYETLARSNGQDVHRQRGNVRRLSGEH